MLISLAEVISRQPNNDYVLLPLIITLMQLHIKKRSNGAERNTKHTIGSEKDAGKVNVTAKDYVGGRLQLLSTIK